MLMLTYTGMKTHVDATAAMSRRPQENTFSGRPSMFYPVGWVAGNGPFEVCGRWSGGAPGHPENPDGNAWRWQISAGTHCVHGSANKLQSDRMSRRTRDVSMREDKD